MCGFRGRLKSSLRASECARWLCARPSTREGGYPVCRGFSVLLSTSRNTWIVRSSRTMTKSETSLLMTRDTVERGPPMAFYFVQFLTGLASAASLFLVASGLSIIFGVTRIVNFAHGAFYMLGAYVAFTLTERFSGAIGFWGGIVVAAADRRRGRRAGRDGAAAADLSRARTVSAAGDLRPDPDGRGSGGADLGPGRPARAAGAGISRARLISSARTFRPTICS